jgi:hypothetical protein
MAEIVKNSRSLVEILKDRAKDIRPKRQATNIEGVFLKVLPRTELDVSATAIRSLTRAGRSLHRVKGQILRANERKDSWTEALTSFAEKHPNFRGLVSIEDNLSVSVFPVAEVKYNEKKVRKSLGEAATTVIGEELRATLSIPLGHKTPDGPLLTSRMAQNSLKQTVRGFGFSRRATRAILHTEIVPTFDELKLHELVENGQVNLPEDAATITETFHARTNLIDKSLGQPPASKLLAINQPPTI